jgi:putative hemolysin
VSPELTDVLLIVGCLALSAFFSASETALTALGPAKTRQIVEASGGRHPLRFWLRSPERILSSLIVGNTMVNVAASALATDLVQRFGVPFAVAVATGAITLALLTFGEITPKTFAKTHSEYVARRVMQPVVLVQALLYPITVVFVGIAHFAIRVFGGEPKPRAPAVTSEEIDYLISLGSKEGVLIDKVKQELLTSVLDFADMVVKETMVPRTRMIAVEQTAAIDELMKVLTDSGLSRIPVYSGTIDNITGILFVKDLVGDLAKSEPWPPGFKIDKYLRPAFFVPEVMKISRLLREFQRRRTQIAIVVDEFGGTSGLVTMEDVVEEIVGDIDDEHAAREKPVKTISAGVFLADGSVPLRDLEPHLGVEFPEEGDYETLGGFLTASAGRVPPVGSVIVWRGIAFTVRVSDEKHVAKVEISKKPESPVPDSGGGGDAKVIRMPKVG